MQTKREYINSFDGVRTLALVGVFFYHLIPAVFRGGYLGVVIFFVLAGYLSFDSAMYVGEMPEHRVGVFFNTLLKKIRKLYPAMLFMMFFVVLVMLIFFRGELASNSSDIRGSVLSLNNYFQIFSGKSYFDVAGILNPFTHIWALSLEMQFYILFFAFFYGRYTPRKKQSWFLLLLMVTALSYLLSVILLLFGADYSRVYFGLFTRMYSFSLGGVAALIARRSSNDLALLSKSKRGLFSLVLLFVAGISFLIVDANAFTMYIGMLLYSLIIAFLLLFLRPSETVISEILSLRIFGIISERSYHIFLWHFPIIKIFEKFFAHSNMSVFWLSIVTIIFTLVLSELSYRFIKLLTNGISFGMMIIVVFVVGGLLSALPYDYISSTSSEKKALENMQKTIEENEKLQESGMMAKKGILEYEDFKSEYIYDSELAGFDDDEVIVADALTSSGSKREKKKTNEELNEEDPRFKSSIEDVKWVNENAEGAFMDVEEYKDYRNTRMLIIGDSIASMCYDTIMTYMPASICKSKKAREFHEAFEVYKEFSGTEVGEYIVLALGTNGEMDEDSVDRIRAEVGNKKIILTTIVLPFINQEKTRNEAIVAYAKTHENVYLVDFNKVAKNHSDWFFEDNIHPNIKGARVYSQLIMKKIIELENE